MQKHLLKSALCLCLIIILASALALSASAAENITEINPEGGGHQYYATYTNEKISESGFYLIIALKKSAVTLDADKGTYSIKSNPLTADSILYIDQTTGEAGGKVTFGTSEKTWIPKSFVGGQVFVIGTGLPATWIGSLTEYGVQINGEVSFIENAKTQPTATLTPKEGGDPLTITTVNPDLEAGTAGVEGSAIPEGQYTLTITKKGYLPYTLTITVTGDDIILPEGIELLAGDANGDGMFINASDLAAILGVYKSNDPAVIDTPCNVNEDSFVNATDLSTVLGNYKKSYQS